MVWSTILLHNSFIDDGQSFSKRSVRGILLLAERKNIFYETKRDAVARDHYEPEHFVWHLPVRNRRNILRANYHNIVPECA
jgi:hypothetical protein